MAESQVAKKNFLELKQKAEIILAQLQEEARQTSYGAASSDSSQFPVYATVRKDRTRKDRDGARGGKVTRNIVAEHPTVGEESPYQLRPRSLMLSYKH